MRRILLTNLWTAVVVTACGCSLLDSLDPEETVTVQVEGSVFIERKNAFLDPDTRISAAGVLVEWWDSEGHGLYVEKTLEARTNSAGKYVFTISDGQCRTFGGRVQQAWGGEVSGRHQSVQIPDSVCDTGGTVIAPDLMLEPCRLGNCLPIPAKLFPEDSATVEGDPAAVTLIWTGHGNGLEYVLDWLECSTPEITTCGGGGMRLTSDTTLVLDVHGAYSVVWYVSAWANGELSRAESPFRFILGRVTE